MSEKIDARLAEELTNLRKRLAQCERAVARHKRAEELARNEAAELRKLLKKSGLQSKPRKSSPGSEFADESVTRADSESEPEIAWGSKEAWLSTMAHELKQPLTAILNYTQACASLVECGKADSAELLHALKQASLQAERAAELVLQLRHVAVPGELRRSTVQLHDSIRQALRLLENELQAARIEVELKLADSLPAVQADARQVSLVLLNLLRNAIDALEKCAPGKRQIKVATQHRAAEIEVAVSDTGEGMSLATARNLFKPYESSKPDGMGLGLAMCRAIVQAHGGRLWAKPNRPRGTVFSFTLPTSNPK